MNNVMDFFKAHIGKKITSSPSALTVWLGPVLLQAEEGKLVFEYIVRKEMTNPMGMLHGGVSAAIVDDAIGITVATYGMQDFFATINNVVDYFSSAKEGDTIIAETIVIKKGRQLINVQCDIWNADRSRLIVKGYSNLIKTDLKKTT